MKPEQLKSSELDRLMRNALTSNDELVIPPGLADNTIRKLKKRMLLRELILELLFKMGLAMGSMAILAVVFVLINGNAVLTRLYTQIVNNSQLITSLLLLVLVTILIDQVGLKYYTTFKKEVA